MPSLPVHAVEYQAKNIGPYRRSGGPQTRQRPARLYSTIDALQLPLAVRDRTLGVLGARAVVGEHVDHQEVGDRGRGLLGGRTNTGSGERALAGLTENGVLRICSPHRRRVIG